MASGTRARASTSHASTLGAAWPDVVDLPAAEGYRAAAGTRTGSRRSINQDRWMIVPAYRHRPALLAVADGVGGEAAGERASASALEALEQAWRAWLPDGSPDEATVMEVLHTAARAADDAVHHLTASDPACQGAATTLSVAAVFDETVVVAHAGDSPAYLARQGIAQQITADHTWVAEQVASEQLDVEQASRHPMRHVITRYLGQEGGCVFDVFAVPRQADHQVILCTDGVSNVITPFELARSPEASSVVQNVLGLVDARNGHDDATIVALAPTGVPADPFGLRPVLRPSRAAQRSRRTLLIAGVGTAAVGAAGLVAGGLLLAPRAAARLMAPFKTPPLEAAQAYFNTWQSGDYGALYNLLSGSAQQRIDREAFIRRHEAIATEMTLISLSAAPTEAPDDRPNPTEASLPFDVRYRTARFGELQRQNTLPLVWERSGWRVDWRPAVILPELTGGRLVRAISEPLVRGAILDRQRRPLATRGTGGDSRTGRVYPHGTVAGPQVGYIGQVTADELKEAAKEGYLAGDTRGKVGVEAAAEALLTGRRGGRLTVIQPTGEEAATLAAIPSRPGENVLLSLD
ncbi:MAG TPA: protein phosphatase 2C domain-containing protein, partial [Chloroflexota bacterium]|nr:protein phosphatase 2C domain-containing protein [Chloroflexota bacterium]